MVDGRFQVIEMMNDNVYKLALPSKYIVNASFNAAHLSPFNVHEDLRTNLF